MSKITRYLKERAKWRKFGKPLRTPEEIVELYTICEACPLFKKNHPIAGECTECECTIKKIGTFFNKLAWGTTKCPLEEPKWVESETRYQKFLDITDADVAASKKDLQSELRNNSLDIRNGGSCCG